MIKRNLIANFLGQGWTALMGLAFIPVYIKYLGVEAYGLIGLFAVLQAWLTLLDVGMTPTLGREMARFTGGAISAQQIRDLLRSIEVMTLTLVIGIAVVSVLSSSWVATNWLKPENLSLNTVSTALAAMGIATATKFAEGIYRSSLIGLQHQVLYNVVSATLATIRAVGAVVVVALIAPTIQAFFLWQGLVSLVSVIVLAILTYRVMPSCKARPHFSLAALRTVWHFARGMMGITLLSLLLMQIDKVILSKLLSLSDYGYYILAAAVAGGLFNLISPITQTFYPKLCEMHAQNSIVGLHEAYHTAAQLVTVIGGSVAIVVIVFSEDLLMLWTSNLQLSAKVAPLLSLIILGNLLNGLLWVPYHTQLAFGWTGLAIRVNIVAVAVIVPSIFWITPQFGAVGAAWIWVCLNTAYLFIGVHFMFRKIIRTEKYKWFMQDVFLPLFTALIIVMVCAALLGNADQLSARLISIMVALLLAGSGAFAVSTALRNTALDAVGFRRHPF
jgi:O-antigen/teichoic acid export membrane protein